MLKIQRVNAEHEKPASMVKLLSILGWNLEHIWMDFVVVLVVQRTLQSHLVIIDWLTKTGIFLPIKGTKSLDKFANYTFKRSLNFL